MWKVLLTTSFVYYLYIVVGGCIFMILDSSQQLGLDEIFNPNTTRLFSEMRRTLLEVNVTEEEITRIVDSWVKGSFKNYFSNETLEYKDISWTYSNAFFFAFHLCSTIGYGDVSPNTVLGEMFAVLYAAIGIPVHILFFKLLNDSFAQSYQEIIGRIIGEEESDMKKRLGDLVFYCSWTVVLFVIPAVAFMFTEDWSFLEGVYYSFTTASTVGLGDYVAGSTLSNRMLFTLYKLLILTWMIYGLAFFAMIVDYLTHLYQTYMLFSFKWSCRTYVCEMTRIYVDIEKLDLHFRIVKSQGAKHKFSMWAPREGIRKAVGFQTNHMSNLGLLTERIQGELIDLLQIYDRERQAIGRTRYPKKDLTRVKIPIDAFPVRKIPRDAFPVRKTPEEAENNKESPTKDSSNDESGSDRSLEAK